MAKETLINPRQEISSPLIKTLDNQITKLADPTAIKTLWRQYWQDSSFADLFPALSQRLLSEEGSQRFTSEQRKRIFELGFVSFIEIPWARDGSAAVNGKAIQLNEGATVPLARAIIGFLIAQGLASHDKAFIHNLILNPPKEIGDNKQVSGKMKCFRDNLTQNVTLKSPFRQWVEMSGIEERFDFEWDREVAQLLLKLVPQDEMESPDDNLPANLPKILTSDFKEFSPLAIDEFLNYALKYATRMPITGKRSIALTSFLVEVREKIANGSFNHDPTLLNMVTNKLDELGKLLNLAS